MKTIYNFTVCFVFLFLSAGIMSGQTTIVQWDFNGATGTSTPSVGSGTALLVGGTSATFKSGSTTDPIGATAVNNQAWQTSSYAALGTGNKQSGVQFNVSTVGYNGITFKFDQRLSNTANDTYVVQYTIDRTAIYPTWVDAHTFTFTPAATGTGDMWYNGRTVDLSAVTGLNNNPNVAIRVVSAFDPTTSNYLSATSGGTTVYATSGTVRFDMVTFMAAQTLGINDFTQNKQSFSFYPNPTKGDLIHFNDTVSVRIFDVTGKAILNANNVKELNLESLSSGIYFIEDEDKTVIKMIKN